MTSSATAVTAKEACTTNGGDAMLLARVRPPLGIERGGALDQPHVGRRRKPNGAVDDAGARSRPPEHFLEPQRSSGGVDGHHLPRMTRPGGRGGGA